MKRILINNRRPATKAKEQAEQIVAQREKLKIFVENIRYGDWFVLNQMSKNLEHKFFVDFVVRLSTKINSKRLEGKFLKHQINLFCIFFLVICMHVMIYEIIPT